MDEGYKVEASLSFIGFGSNATTIAFLIALLRSNERIDQLIEVSSFNL